MDVWIDTRTCLAVICFCDLGRVLDPQMEGAAHEYATFENEIESIWRLSIGSGV